MQDLTDEELLRRDRIAARLITALPSRRPPVPEAFLKAGVAGRPADRLTIAYPDGTRPVPAGFDKAPDPLAPLPKADIIVIAYTQAEAAALSDVLSPGVDYVHWYPYARNFEAQYKPVIADDAPAMKMRRLGTYYPVTVGKKKVLVMKSELHLARDKKRLSGGRVSLPIRSFFKQIIQETGAGYVITTGTAGGNLCSQHLGDVVVTRSGQFMCRGWFKEAPYNGKRFTSRSWAMPTAHRAFASQTMQSYADRLTGGTTPPEKRCSCGEGATGVHPLNVHVEGENGIPVGTPILTTDTFDYGTSLNGYGKIGLACEMDDAVLGMVCAEDLRHDAPRWVSVRNLSDPCINGELTLDEQHECATSFYEEYGYWTSVMGSLVCWSIVAGL